MNKEFYYNERKRKLVEKVLSEIGYNPQIVITDLPEGTFLIESIGVNEGVYTYKPDRRIRKKEIRESCQNNYINLDFLVERDDLIAGRADDHYFLIDNKRNLFALKYTPWPFEGSDESKICDICYSCKKILGDELTC